MYHLELRQFPRVSREFNLSDATLAPLLAGWLGGGSVRWGEQDWEPRKAKLTVLEGPELDLAERGMGRGWPAAQRAGRDVTSALLTAAKARLGGGNEFREELLALCAAGEMTLAGLVALAGRHGPGRPISERVATVERAAWELLHTGAVELLDGPETEPLAAERWHGTLLDWRAWGPRGARMRARPKSP